MQSLKLGTHITGGDIYGTVQENRMIRHKVLYIDVINRFMTLRLTTTTTLLNSRYLKYKIFLGVAAT